MINDSLISEIKNKIKNEPDIMACYIFGSYQKDYISKESDFDIAFVVKDKKIMNEKRIYELIRNIRFPKDLDISVVDRKSSPLFLFQIISSGKRIYAKDENQANSFEAFVLNNYYDTQHMRNIYYNYLKDKFSCYGRK